MTAKNLQNLKTYLEDAGFAEQKPGVFVWNTEAKEPADRHQLPWTLHQWTLESRVSHLVQTDFGIQLQSDDFLRNISDLFQTTYPSFRTAGLHQDAASGFWILFEFVNPELEADQSRLIEEHTSLPEQLPHGLAGLHLSLQEHLGHLSIYMTKHFFIGNVPGKMFIELPKIVSLAMFGESLRNEVHFNAYVATVDAEDLRRVAINSQRLAASEDSVLDPQQYPRPFPEVRLRLEGTSWKLDWTFESDLPAMVVPPIEVLEQKEVSRRFQQLDELILLESYEEAEEKCLEYLEKFPSSLYLIRRLAFLSLWTGAAFDKKWLETLSRFDAQNLMAISLWIKRSTLETGSDTLLENLSKLGNSLGQSIVRFEEADITSLTLPEMLGDAWNSKDDQRAVACYERVLQTRGEIPRILVKLIRLMRDLDDAPAEEVYIDRLLACEVPIRTRAAIYFRLAEIKESVDQKEAVQWALKSWQTNHSHVRYALLTAKLLIGLGRAHEAVHVLVETSEHLSGEETRGMRLELEIRIATIWFESLQRSDLAVERLGRARELGADELPVLQSMLDLAERLNESSLYIELLLQFLETASRKGEQELADVCVQKLVKLASVVENIEHQGLIYSQVLTRSLIDAKIIENIISNPLLELPHAKILASLEEQIESVSADKRGGYLQLMGDIAWRFIEDAPRARVFYERALRDGHLNQSAFDFLDQIYAREGLNDQRYGLLKRRYELAPPAEKSVILRELYYFDEGVSESERDDYALQIYLADKEDTGPFEERMALYEQQGAIASIATLLEQLFERSPEQVSHLPLLERAIQAIQHSSYEGRFSLMHQLYERIDALQSDHLETARRALHSLWSDPEKAFAGKFLDRLLAAGEVPELEPDEMLAVLPDQVPKVQLLVQLAERVSENRAIGYLRRAVRLSRQLNVSPQQMQVIVHRLSELTILQDDELSEYIKIVRLSGLSLPILGVFAQQMLLAHDDTSRGKFAQMAIEFLGHGPKDDNGLENLKLAIPSLSPENQLDIKTAWLAVFGWDDALHSQDFAFQVLHEKKSWRNPDAMIVLIERFSRDWQNEAALGPVLTETLDGFMEEKNSELINFYSDRIENLFGFPLLMNLSEYFIKARELARAERTVASALQREPAKDIFSGALQRLQQCAHDMNLAPWLLALLSELIDPNRTPPFSPEILKETTFFYAQWLLQQEKDLRRVLRYFEQIYALDPRDQRFWAPLIQLYREFNADTDLYELLYQVLPQLRKDPSSVKALGLDLANLEADLNRIGQTLGLSSEQTNVETQFASEPLADKVGPHGTQVVYEFDQRDLSTVARDSKLPPPVQIVLTDLDDEPLPPLVKDENSFSVSKAFYQADNQASLNTKISVPPELPKPEAVKETPGAFVLNIDDEPQESSPEKTQISLMDESDGRTQFLPPPPVPPVTASDDAPDTGTLILPDPNENAIGAFNEPNEPQTELKSHILFEPEDWRLVASRAQAKEGICAWLLKHPLPDKAEQHVALQITALFEDKVQLLESWNHKIWRQPNDFFFDLRWSDRMGREMFHPGTKTPLSRLMRQLLPVISFQFISQMNLKGLSERLKAKPEDILRVRRPLEWKDEIIQKTSLRFYTKYFIENRFQLFHLPTIEDRVHFDYEKREIYIDREHYLQVPPTHLFHRLAFLSRALQLEYFPFLVLSPLNEVYPVLMRCRRMLEQNRSDSFKRILGIEKDPMRVFLAQTDREALDALFKEVGIISADKVAKISQSFIEQIYRINIAETLDIVGIVESISNINIYDKNVRPMQAIEQSALLKSVLAFVADLRFGQKGPF